MLSVKEAEISSLDQERDSLKEKADELQKKLDKEKNANSEKAEMNQKLLLAVKYYTDGDRIMAATSVNGYSEGDFDTEETKALFKMVSKKLTAQDVKKLFEDGRAAFNSGKYDDAEKLLLQVLSYDEKNQDALYFMGRVYHQRGKKKKAQEYYQKVLDVDDKTGRATEARTRMRQLGQ